MVDPRSKARIERILNSEFRPDDLLNLLLYARDKHDGRKTVWDVGSFISHSAERDRGASQRAAKDWFTVVGFFMPRFAPGGPHALHGEAMPPTTREYFKIAVNRLPAESIKRDTGLKRSKAYTMMGEISERLTPNPDGTWALPQDLSQKEFDLVKCVASMLVVRPAYDGETLFGEFIDVLRSNGLISREQIREHKDRLRTLLLLYAISAMHNTVIKIDDGIETTLKASPDTHNKSISVDASAPNPNGVGAIFAPLFVAEIDPSAHCAPVMLERRPWDFDIELAPNGKLAPLN